MKVSTSVRHVVAPTLVLLAELPASSSADGAHGLVTVWFVAHEQYPGATLLARCLMIAAARHVLHERHPRLLT